MDPWDYNKPIDHHRLRNLHRRDHRHPSFSSTLLDQIYRSIDDSSTNSDVSMRKKQNRAAGSLDDNRRVIADDFVRSRNPKTVEPVFFKHSSSSSSDSSGLSSSESDSIYRRSRSSRSSPPVISHPKPIRTTVERSPQAHRPNNKQEHGSFLKTKSKALKIYSDLKKVKQPISPGGRLATFLNSIFTGAGNTKKPSKINTTTTTAAAAAAASSTTCSSASSFSRSCLSKTPSSSEKSKRSVRFCPVNVIYDEDSSKRYGHNNNGNNEREYESTRHHYNKNFDSTLEIRVMEENRRVIEAAKELLRTYQKKNKDVKISGEEEEDDDDDDDDVLSCASSDLFELDNLSSIGIERYREELPVYETTRLNTNRIISR